MIIKANPSHKEEIAHLWNEAFGDKPEDVLGYLDFLLEYFFVSIYNDKVCAIASVLPLESEGCRGGYIYAVATLRSMRGKGFSSELINYIKNLDEFDFYVLVPQSCSLFEFYKRFGFVSVNCVETKSITITHEVGPGVECREISAEKYSDLRNKYFKKNLAKWNSEVLNFAKKMYSGRFYEISDKESKTGICFCYKNGDILVIKELLCPDASDIANWIGTYFNASLVKVTFESHKSLPSAMVFPENFAEIYFNIALD